MKVLIIILTWPIWFLSAALLAAEPALPSALSPENFRPFHQSRAELGRLLFYDKLLSGNRNISCGTCHNHDLASGDGLSLGIGEGGEGLGTDRQIPSGRERPRKRVPRNANALFNLGHTTISVLFHDGRVSDEDTYGVGFNSPAEEWLPPGLQSVVAVQALFPLTAEVEMAGRPEDNDIAAARNRRIDQVWPLVVERIAANPDYVALFIQAYDEIDGQADISAVHIANAIDDFIGSEWRATNTPFDQYLNGETDALTSEQRAGMDLFFGDAGCANCHSGPLLTDQKFHALAIPPFGPGRVRRYDPMIRDVGRMSETDDLDDIYRFRTPALRNVAQTGPWGHNGAFATLDGIVRHHLDPLHSLRAWQREQVVMPKDAQFDLVDFAIWEDDREMARYAAKIDIEPTALSDSQIAQIVDFLGALTDQQSLRGRLGKPKTVPSGLSVD